MNTSPACPNTARLSRAALGYLNRAASPYGLCVGDVQTVGVQDRLPRPLFDLIENGLLVERRDRNNGYSTGGHTLIHRLYGWDLTSKGRSALETANDH